MSLYFKPTQRVALPIIKQYFKDNEDQQTKPCTGQRTELPKVTLSQDVSLGIHWVLDYSHNMIRSCQRAVITVGAEERAFSDPFCPSVILLALREPLDMNSWRWKLCVFTHASYYVSSF